MDCSRQIGDLHDDKFLLIHGMADKVVDISQSWYVSQALIRHGVLFTQMVRVHLYNIFIRLDFNFKLIAKY